MFELTLFLVAKSSIVEHVLNWAKFKADQQLKKTDGSRKSRSVVVCRVFVFFTHLLSLGSLV